MMNGFGIENYYQDNGIIKQYIIPSSSNKSDKKLVFGYCKIMWEDVSNLCVKIK